MEKARGMKTESRRKLLLLGGAAALIIGWQRYGVRREPLVFEPVRGAPGWQFATAGSVSGLSGTGLVTVGLDRGPEPLAAARLEPVVHRDGGAGAKLAVFSDFFCPYCRELIGRVRALQSDGPPLSVTWHELPLLGPNSVIAARAAEAASLQDGYVPFHAQLVADGFRPVAAWMKEVAARAGLDGARLSRDMDGALVAERLADSAGAAARLGFFATPGLVVGRRAVLGALDRDRLVDLLAQERT